MKTKLARAFAALAMLTALPVLAQDSDHSWSKTYPVTGTPTLTFETSDANVAFQTCAECNVIRIHVEVAGEKISDYRLEEGQSGNEIHFSFKELPHVRFHVVWHREPTHVTVETPAHITLQARTADGNVTMSGLQGELALNSGD